MFFVRSKSYILGKLMINVFS